MLRRLGIDVAEREHQIVFINICAGISRAMIFSKSVLLIIDFEHANCHEYCTRIHASPISIRDNS